MRFLRKVTFLTIILLTLTSATATWLIIDSYTRYGVTWQVTTTIGATNTTHTESILTQTLITALLWTLTFVLFLNHRENRRLTRLCEAQQQDEDKEKEG